MKGLLFSSIVIYFISCASSDDDKYSLITKEERKSIGDFCKCTEPIQPLIERLLNYLQDTTKLKNIINDSSFVKSMYDSLDIMIKEITPCAEKVKNIFDSKKMEKEKEEQLISYLRKYYPKCAPLMLASRIKNKVKFK